MNYQINYSMEKDPEFKMFIQNKIKQFNRESSDAFKELTEEKIKPFHVSVEDSNEMLVGGLTGRVIWDWLEVDYFWLSPEVRGKGIGEDILKKAEKEAVLLGVTKILLTTFEFQARSFYEKYGYEVVGEVKDYPPGTTYYTMVKTIN